MASPALVALKKHGVHAHRSPVVAASRLPSFHLQTRAGTVAGRFRASCEKSQLRFAGSGSHSPPRWRTRELRSDVVPALRKKRANSGDRRAGLSTSRPGFQPLALLSAGPPLRCRRDDTRPGAFLRNLLTIARNRGGVNEFAPLTAHFPGNGPPGRRIRARYRRPR